MSKGKPNFNYNNCMACGICVAICPLSCLKLSKTNVDKYKKAYPELALQENCKECGICAGSCPLEAIKHIPSI
ncbi:MAG TPA: 4Fe-4S binding protein [Desulfosporosinus sp.]|nr:4Fe-4S binding protein [Desulfosporosinus sp.]